MTAAPQQQFRRRGPRPGPAPQQANAIAIRPEVRSIVGGTRDISEIARRLDVIREHCHVLSPISSAQKPPRFFEMRFDVLKIDIDTETYPQSGARALTRVALDKIAGLVGVSWIKSERTSPRTEKRRCSWIAVGVVRDGTDRLIVGNAELDVEDDGAWTEITYATAKAGTDPDKTLAERCHFLTRHAETRAKSAAIRSLGIRHTYTVDELQKPFVVVKAVPTGKDDDPAAEVAASLMILERALSSSHLLFGAPAAPRLAPSASHAIGTASSALPAPISEVTPQASPSTSKPETKPEESQPRTEQRAADEEEQPYSGFKIPYGAEAGKPIEEASNGRLQRIHDEISGRLAAGTNNPRFVEKDRALLAAIQAEMEWRAGGNEYDEDAPENQLPEGYG